jgi:heme exporter protein D
MVEHAPSAGNGIETRRSFHAPEHVDSIARHGRCVQVLLCRYADDESKDGSVVQRAQKQLGARHDDTKMSGLIDFLHMGGYAGYVWSAYGIALVVLLWNLVVPVLNQRETERLISNQLSDDEQ